MALKYGPVIFVDDFKVGGKYRCDVGNTYRDGGKEYNVRDITGYHDRKFVRGQVTRFYQNKDGTFRQSNPKKSKQDWHHDTPASQWLPFEPFAKALKEYQEKARERLLERRKASSHCRVIRKGKYMLIDKRQAKPSEVEAWNRGDRI